MDNFEKEQYKTEEDHAVVFPEDEQSISALGTEAKTAEERTEASTDEPEGEALSGEVSDAEADPDLTGIYAKLHDMEPKKMTVLQMILGVFSGVLCWGCLRITSFVGQDNGLLRWAFLIVFAVLMLGSNYLGRKAKVNVQKFRLGLIIGLGSCIAIFAVVFFATGRGYGLIELLFNAGPA